MSPDFQFSIRRSWAMVLAGCCAVAIILLFFAGAVTGLLYSGNHVKAMQVANLASAAKRAKPGADNAPKNPVDTAAAPTAEPASGKPVPASNKAGNTAPVEAETAPSSATALPSPTAAVPAPEPPPASSADHAKISAASASTKPLAEAAPEVPVQPAEASLTIPLAVQVGAFSIKSNAATLVQSLRDMGYKPALSRSTDIHGHVWYLVKLGPYTKWITASRVAARISIAENVKPVIGPMQ